jgi:AAA15 family ATPase/GTPase
VKIKKVRLFNGYKRFHDLTIDLGLKPKRVIVLVGPNGCGKSSVLDGLLFKKNSYSPIDNTGTKDYTYHSMVGEANFAHTNLEIEFEEGAWDAIYEQKTKAGKENTIFSFRSPYRYNSSLKVTQSMATQEIRLNNYGASVSSDLDQKMESNYRRLYIKYNKYLHDQDCAPSQAKAHIIGQLNSSFRACLNLELHSIGDIEASKGTLYFKKPDHPREFEFNVLSSGEKEVIDILLDLYLRRDDYADSIFLLDEPELHISTAIQKLLLIEINKLIGENCQLWISTHSIGFLRALQDEFSNECQIIHFKTDMELASKPSRITPAVMSANKWREIFEVAVDDLVRLVSPKKIVYCEGRDRPSNIGAERGFDAKVFNSIFGESHQEVLFVSSGGNTELDQRSSIALAVLSKALPGVEILVLKDRDISSGRMTSENDRRVHLENSPQNHSVLQRWEIENYLFDKEILRKYCSDKNLVFDETEYDRFVSNITDQDLKDEIGKIKNICGINTSINAESFKLNLARYVSSDTLVYQELEKCTFDRV